MKREQSTPKTHEYFVHHRPHLFDSGHWLFGNSARCVQQTRRTGVGPLCAQLWLAAHVVQRLVIARFSRCHAPALFAGLWLGLAGVVFVGIWGLALCEATGIGAKRLGRLGF